MACTQCRTLGDTCPQWGMGEERRICCMYVVMGEDLSHVSSGGDAQ